MDARLYLAARSGDVRALINIDNESPHILQSMAPGGNTILHIAAREGHVEFVNEAIARGMSLVMQANDEGDTPLHCAARTGRLIIIELLMTRVDLTSLRRINNMGNTVLIEAITNRLDHVVMKLLTMDHSINESAQLLEETKALVRTPDGRGQYALHHAARQDNASVVLRLLKIDPSLAYILDNDGLSPLHIAATFDSTETFELLIKGFPDAIEQLDPRGMNALQISAISGWSYPVVQTWRSSPQLKSAIEEADKEQGNTLLHLAAIYRNIPLARWLLKNKIVNSAIKNKDSYTALDLLESKTEEDFIQLFKSEHVTVHGQKLQVSLPLKNRSFNDEEFRAQFNTCIVGATLIATVTFAATFTMPGGYNSSSTEDGGPRTATLVNRSVFKAFLIFNTLAMICSLSAIGCYRRAWGLPFYSRLECLSWGDKLMHVAVLAMLFSMMTGIYTVVGPESPWLAISVYLIDSIPPSIYFLAIFVGRQYMQNFFKPFVEHA